MSFIPKKFFKSVFIALVAALIIKTFLIDAFNIPTASMENTLLPGDFILINKAAYSISTPQYITILNLWLKSYRLIKIKEPERNDVIVFKFPGYPDEFEPAENSSYIKRIIGLPGDTLEIKNGSVFINNNLIKAPAGAILPGDNSGRELIGDPLIYPHNSGWRNDSYGPLVIPARGDTVKLTNKNIADWQALIDRELGHKAVSVEGSVINIDNKAVRDYVLEKNYYFVLGDNRQDSMDSRYWGFVPDDYIIGKALLIYWSWDSDKKSGGNNGFLSPFRFNRIFKLIE